LRCERDGQASEGTLDFGNGAGADEREGGEGLMKHVSEGNIDRRGLLSGGQFDGAISALKILGAIPASN